MTKTFAQVKKNLQSEKQLSYLNAIYFHNSWCLERLQFKTKIFQIDNYTETKENTSHQR